MLKKTLLYFVLLAFFSCSSTDEEPVVMNNNDDETPIVPNVSLISDIGSIVIDEEVMVMLSSNLPIETVEVSSNNFETSSIFNLAGNTEREICISFREIGNNNVSTRTQFTSGETIVSSLNFNVSIGTPVKINGIRVYSFFNINETWDNEYNEGDPNRLADVLVLLGKEDCSYQGGNASILHLTSIVENVSEELFWDLSSLNIYVGIDKEVRIDVLDDDPGVVNYDEGIFVSVIEDGTNNVPVFNVSDYSSERPESIRFTENQENGYDIEIYLEWIE
ncbi:hypothetical protein ACFO3O_09215 [Dokdonia ponticola]|uniref:DNRLRE domain-containing protein n=1 Tax=Dokdonia ponticola TaxID=2041041 RepID=A0ABV9HYI3_9FLAO